MCACACVFIYKFRAQFPSSNFQRIGRVVKMQQVFETYRMEILQSGRAFLQRVKPLPFCGLRMTRAFYTFTSSSPRLMRITTMAVKPLPRIEVFQFTSLTFPIVLENPHVLYFTYNLSLFDFFLSTLIDIYIYVCIYYKEFTIKKKNLIDFNYKNHQLLGTYKDFM